MLSSMGDVIPVDLNAVSDLPGLVQADLGKAEALHTLLDQHRPRLIVNAAAYTAVDRAEEDQPTAELVNAQLPSWLAGWAESHGAAMVHYSTDYVFNGRGERPYAETDATGPESIYGSSKLAGEMAVREAGCPSLTLRTSWVYSSHGHNFVLSMLKLAQTRPELSIVDDQIGCPTWARNLALATVACIKRGLLRDTEGGRLLHYCDAGPVSWFEFAELIFEISHKLGLLPEKPVVLAIKSSEYPQAATRPMYSVLDTGALQSLTGFEPQRLRHALSACLEELLHAQ